jgi:DNA-binding IclR family transcriptional regulator
MSDHPNVPVRSVETTLRIVAAIQARDEVGVSELADSLGIAKSTAHNHLRTLERHGYVVQEGDSFRLGFRWLDVGGHVRDRNPEFRYVRPKVRKIAETSGEICQFIVREADTAIVVFMERGGQAVETNTRVGRRRPLDQHAAGRVLATLSGEDTTGREISDALERDGYVAADETQVKGLRAIVVPITNTDGYVLGVLRVAGPAHRLSDPDHEQRIANAMLDASNELELNVSYSRY